MHWMQWLVPAPSPCIRCIRCFPGIACLLVRQRCGLGVENLRSQERMHKSDLGDFHKSGGRESIACVHACDAFEACTAMGEPALSRAGKRGSFPLQSGVLG